VALIGGTHGADAATAPALALAGALAGFLLWNRPPAHIFLGDGGAYAAGAVLAAVTAIVARDGGWQPALGAVVCLGVFLFEIAFTILRRLPSGRLTVGDRLHSYDILAARLGSRGHATIAFWALGVASVGVGVVIAAAPPAAALALAVATVVAVAIGGHRLWASRPPQLARTPV
jgi:UDP-N-acetylmuramyl pentapeptide phosphotransferase/UDP-N-acetylglucosamine-1-phosphate transferase